MLFLQRMGREEEELNREGGVEDSEQRRKRDLLCLERPLEE